MKSKLSAPPENTLTYFLLELRETDPNTQNGSSSSRVVGKPIKNKLYGSQKSIKEMLSGKAYDKLTHKRQTSLVYTKNPISTRKLNSFAVLKLNKGNLGTNRSVAKPKSSRKTKSKAVMSRISNISSLASSAKFEKGYLTHYSNMLTERTSETNRVRKSRDNVFHGSLT